MLKKINYFWNNNIEYLYVVENICDQEEKNVMQIRTDSKCHGSTST